MAPRWIPPGRQFAAPDIVFFAGRGALPLPTALLRFELLVTGPHATAAIPEELRPFLHPGLSERQQFDFSDVSTSPIARRWAEIDERVLYVENPHPRLVLDPNRPPPADLEAALREAFRRLRMTSLGRRADLAGVDAVRSVTFAGQPVLLEPPDAAGWQALLATLRRCVAQGTAVYMAARDALLDALLRRHRSHAAPPRLHCISLHDTMAALCRPDGAISEVRPPGERLPALVSLGNRGDPRGEPMRDARGRIAPEDLPTLAPAELRRVAAAFRVAAGVAGPGAGRHVALNRVYRGAEETIAAGARMRAAAEAIGLASPARQHLGAYMAEFAREALLDPAALRTLREPGTQWPAPDPAQVDRMARLLRAAYDALRAETG